ncbi:ABC transporter substrate-binding protein [Herbidospora sp. NBRC 101105]|uniref:ABC transporter substrate-binding protein n=1 Tax=Herbidospora sp. NBRC 101105 TaxID=3032195 RepID=UPI0024A14B32|nr:ABC transporter substrate-binding protein [Herbidospora sp. NBRC 101105]GLX97270.1 ABC transporter substrate-binding protein [Herbidospora sp. NBRC 101105]
MKIRRSAGALTAAVALSLLTACGGGNAAAPSSPGGQGGKTLVIDTAFQLKTTDPARMFEPTGLLIDQAVYDTLLTFKGGDVTKPVPALAESFTASDDAKTFTFKLRPDAKFSDGTPVTSADVAFSLNRVKNVKGNPSFLMAGLTVTAPDPATVVVASEEPNTAIPFILPNPALGIVNSAVAKKNGASDAEGADKSDTAEAFLNKQSQGSGPYVLESYSTTSQVVLKVNEKYWGPKPAYSRVVVRNTQANVQRLNVQKGESQIAVDLSPEQAKGMGDLQVVNGASPNVFFLFTNDNPEISKISSNPKFQEAVRYGIDYQGLVDLAGEGAVQAPGIVPSVFLGALPAADGIKRDVAKAKAALAESGLQNPTVKLNYPSDVQVNGLNFGDLAARVQANLKEVGINVELAPASVQTALESYRGGTEELGLWQWGPDFPDPSNYLNFLPGQLVGLRAGWAEGAAPELEELGAKARTTVDDTARSALYVDIQHKMNEGGPIMPLIQPAQILVAAKSVTNLQSNALWLVNVRELG